MPQIILCLIIPFIGTTLGAACVFFLRDKINPKLEKTLLGFAGGVMIAASIWSLIIPSIESSKDQYGKFSWFPALIGFAIGIIFLLIIDSIVPHLHAGAKEPEGIKSKLSKSTTLVLAVTIHNIPEGLAVGVMIAGAMANNSQVSIMSALVLAIGIAIQNFPEGAIISFPLKAEGNTKLKYFLYGMVSAIAELISAVIALFITSFIVPILPYILSFAAGAMIYVVVEELIPEAKEGEHTNLSTIGFAIGFALMMVLDIALS